MNASGFKKRNIYAQDDIFQYQLNLSLSNTNGRCNYGFSGESGVINWKFESGRIIDPNNNYIYSYNANTELLISGALSQGTNDIWINNNPIYLGQPKFTNNYEYFYINPENCTVDFNLYINGNVPNYSYSIFDTYYSGELLTLNFINSSPNDIRIFSGNSSNPNFSLVNANDFIISGNSTGILYLQSSGFSPFLQDIPLSFYSNFGNFNFLFNGSGIDIGDQEFYLTLTPENQVVVDGIPSVYTANFYNTSGSNLSVTLSYISGDTGNYYVNVVTTNPVTNQTVSGIINGSGYLTNFVTGWISGYNIILSGYEMGSGSGNVLQYFYATGILNSGYNLLINAQGTGEINANITGTGYGVFTFQGYVGQGNNVLQVGGISGLGSGISNGILYTGNIINGVATYIYDVPLATGLTGVFGPDEYEIVNYQSPIFYGTGFFSQPFVLFGISYATGGLISGKLQTDFGFGFEPGIYTFNKAWTGLASGNSAIIDSFNPTTVHFDVTGTSGIISGIYYTGYITDGCSFQEPIFIPTGVPNLIYNEDGEIVQPLNIFSLVPLNTGEYTGENSNNPNSRTNISRRGNTPSGNGYFNNIFQLPFYTGGGIWTESLTGFKTNTQTNKKGIIKNVSANPLLYKEPITGYFKISGSFTGYQDFIWNGRVSGNFTDYATYIYRLNSSGSFTSADLIKSYPNSYNFTMKLKTGNYGFVIYPATSSATQAPIISFPKNISASTISNFIDIPFQLLYDSTDTVNLGFSYLNGTATNGINYTGINKTLTFNNGEAGLQTLRIPILNNPTDSYFSVILNDINGGYVANKDSIIDNIISVNLKRPVTNNPNEVPGCCSAIIPTGNTGPDQITLCSNILGNQRWSSGDGVFVQTLEFLRPVPADYNLYFNTYFTGMNDRFILKSLSNNGVNTIYDTSYYPVDTPIVISGLTTVPEGTYGLYVEVDGGVYKSNNLRRPWELKLLCNIDSSGSGYDLSPNCQAVDWGLINFRQPTGLDGLGSMFPELYIRLIGLSTGLNQKVITNITPACVAPISLFRYFTGSTGQIYVQNNGPESGARLCTAAINFAQLRLDFPDIASYEIEISGSSEQPAMEGANCSLTFDTYKGGTTGMATDPGPISMFGSTLVSTQIYNFVGKLFDNSTCATGTSQYIARLYVDNAILVPIPV